MERIARFEKVSAGQFLQDVPEECCGADKARECHEGITLPKRATSGAAGYDFVLPFDLTLIPGAAVKVPTGIRCHMAEGWVLQLYPRSSLGFKFQLQLDNTVGIIDADYYNADNEGHIIAKIRNNGSQMITLHKGDRFIQGVFVPFGITEDDHTDESRTGGFGSTDAAK